MRNPKREENGFEGMYAKIKLSQIAFFNEDKNENRYIMIPEDDAVKIYMVEFSDESEYVSRFAEYEKQAKE